MLNIKKMVDIKQCGYTYRYMYTYLHIVLCLVSYRIYSNIGLRQLDSAYYTYSQMTMSIDVYTALCFCYRFN